MYAKCPKCGRKLDSFEVEQVDIKGGHSGVFYKCTYCDTAISCGLDPLKLIDDIAEKVIKKLKKSDNC